MPTIKTKITFLRELFALKEVIDAGQIRIAAERNGIKHSNMSKMILDLESRFKTRLLIRNSSGSIPTNATRQIYADIENISNALNKIIRNLTGPDELTGYISIWTPESFAGSGLLTELSDLYAQHPKIRLDIMMNKAVNISNVDIALFDNRYYKKKPIGVPLFNLKTPTRFFASVEYIEKHGMPTDMNDMLENYDLCVRQTFLEHPKFKFISKRAKKLNTTADSAAVLYQLVNDGAGITLMPNWVHNTNNNLKQIDNIDFEYEFVLTAFANPMTMQTPKVKTFIEFFCDFCKRHNITLEMFD